MNKDLSYVTAAWQSSCELKRETSCNMVYCPFYYIEKKDIPSNFLCPVSLEKKNS